MKREMNVARAGRAVFLSILILCVCLAATPAAQIASGSPYALDQSAIVSGGASSASLGNKFSLTGTFGQSFIGSPAANSPFELYGGFWSFAVSTPPAVAGATFTVNSTADTDDTACTTGAGGCTLREAINAANATVDLDTINFNIGAGTPTIAITSALPNITRPVTIDGNTGGATRVELNGANAGANINGLALVDPNSSGSTIRRLVINRFSLRGILLIGSDNNVIEGNFIGTDSTGTINLGNGTLITNGAGISIESSERNRIGGTTGTTPGGSCTGACNLISGNNRGINIESFSSNPSTLNVIEGNFIGTNVTGTGAIGNTNGIRTFNTASYTQIGGTTVAARNVISGNGNGIGILGGGTQFSTIQGNFIGTNSAGNARIGNGVGINFVNNTQDITVGGATAGAGNVISGNSTAGIQGGINNGTIQGNFIGTDVTGTLDLGNGYGNTNLSAIGGVALLRGSTNNRIGGTEAGAGNVIAFNYGVGVRLGSIPSASAAGTGNRIRGNSIYLNDGLGISLSNGTNRLATPLTNDALDPDTGANDLQNYPVLTTVSESGGTTAVQGTLNSLAGTTFDIDFFAGENKDPSGNGEGQTYLGTQTVTTDGSGNANIAFSYTTIAGKPFTTATATNAATNDTSEFSNAVLLAANPGTFVFSSPTYQAVEGAGVITITVNRANGSTGSACVNYTTGDGTATAGSDYTTASGTFCFNDGETSKTFQVTIANDSTPEPDETINLTLSNPTGGSALGLQSTATLTIINDDSFVTFVVNTTADADDGACTALGTDNGCTLREAINAANATASLDTITFNIGAGNPTITLASSLPGINAPVRLDGNTGGATRVEINGNSLSGAGLNVNSGASRSTIRYLVINRFGSSGISVFASDNNVIEGNFIGTNSDGTADLGNGTNGITLTNSKNNLIGGTTGTTPGGSCTGACNLVSGNNNHGISFDSINGNSSGNTIQGNFIGTNATGTAAIGNSQHGIGMLNASNNNLIGGTTAVARNLISGNNNAGVLLSAAGINGNLVQGNYIGTNTTATAKIANATGVSLFFTATGNTIGGATTGAGNVISGNFYAGVSISTNGAPPNNPPHDNIVQGNFIGTDAAGTLDLGNGQGGTATSPVGGIAISQGAYDNQIGGAGAAANVIAFNYGAGIRLGSQSGAASAGVGNLILNNSIYSNNGLGIALNNGSGIISTPLANDAGDADTGANNRQNYPALSSATTSGGATAVQGMLDSAAGATYRIQFFSNAACDSSGSGEGRTYLGELTNVAPNATFTFNTAVSVSAGEFITAAATNETTGDTSEFSACFTVVSSGDTTPPTVTINQASGQADPTGTNPVNFTVVFNEPVTGFDNSDIALSGTAGVTSIAVTGSGTTYDAAITVATSGTVIPSVNAGAAQDAAGNSSAASTSTDNTVTFAGRPTVTINQASGQADPTSTSPVNFTVVFSESVTGFDNSDISLAGTAGVTGIAVTGSGTTYNVAITVSNSSPGTVIPSVKDNAATDSTGDSSQASTSTDNSVTYIAADTTAPTVQSIMRASANPTAPNTSVQFTVTFSESVTGVDASDFQLNTTGLSGASITSVSAGPGDIYTVTVNTGNTSGVDGTLRLDVTDNDSIVDGANNPLGGTGAGNGNYTSGESYTVTASDNFTAFVVTKTADTGDGVCDADCSLREAITAANTDAGAETITFNIPAGDAGFTSGACAISLASALPELSSMTITGTGANVLTVRRDDAAATQFGIFDVPSGATVAIAGLTITGGDASVGGGVNNDGSLTLTAVAVSGNNASTFGGGIFSNTGSTLVVSDSTISGNSSGPGNGGGVAAAGATTVTRSTVSGNSAVFGGGIITFPGGSSTLLVTNSTVSHNSAQTSGGGIYEQSDTATLRNTIVAANTAGSSNPDVRGELTSQGYNLIGNGSGATVTPTDGDQIGTAAAPIDPILGALQNNGGPTATRALLQGSPAIDKGDDGSASPTADQRGFARPVDLDDTTYPDVSDASDIGAFEAQTAPAGGSVPSFVVTKSDDTADGACDADCSLREAITAANANPGADTITFNIAGAGPHTIQLTSALPDLSQSVRILNNSGEGVTVRRDTGGDYRIFTISDGQLVRISGLTITNGNTSDAGGGINNGNGANLTLSNSTVSSSTTSGFGGGGIYNGVGSILTVNNSTVSGNTATGNGNGGGIAGVGTINITNSTVSDNTATMFGGGIITFPNTTLTLTSSTVSNNSAQQNAGGGILEQSGGATIRNTIVANNTAGTTSPDVRGTFNSEGFNLIENTSGANITETQNAGTNITGQDPNLGALENNGGATETRELLAGSPAIDKGKSFSLTTDQRGLTRPVDLPLVQNAAGGDGADIGAFEAQMSEFANADLSITKTDSPDPVITGGNITYTITVSNAGPSDAQAVSLSDGVPTDTTFVSFAQTDGPTFSCTTPSSGGTGAVNCSAATLANGASATFSLVVKVNAAPGATITNTASVSSTTFDPDAGDTSATATTAVVGSAGLSVTKTDSPDPVSAGDNITYAITVSNAGPTAASAVVLTDTVPASTTLVSVSAPTGFNCGGVAPGGTGTISCAGSTLANGGQAVFTLIVKVNQGATGVITNTASVTSSTADPNPADNSATATTTITNESDLGLTMTVSPDPVAQLGTLTYTMTLTNSGNIAAQNVVLNQTDFTSSGSQPQLQVVSLTAPAGFTCQPTQSDFNSPFAGNSIRCQGATLGVGQSVNFTFTKRLRAGLPNGTVINHNANVTTTTTPEITTANNTATDTTTVVGNPPGRP